MNANNRKSIAIVSARSGEGASAMQQRQGPIEGATDRQDAMPTRADDDVPTSVVTPQEVETMGAVPFLFSGTAALIAAIIMVLFIVFR